MSPKKIGVAAAAVVVLGAGAVGGASLAGAATNDTSGPSYGGGPRGFVEGGHGPGDPGGPGGSQDTAVTGSELAKVKDAVQAKDSAVSVQGVRQDPDGSYDVFGTKGGAPVMLQVSKDLKTINEGQGGPGGPGGPAGHGDAPMPGGGA